MENQSHCTNIGHGLFNHSECPEEKVATGVLSNRCWTDRSRESTAVDDRNIVSAVKKYLKTTHSDIRNNLKKAGVKELQSIVHRRFHEQKYRHFTRRCKPLLTRRIGRANKNKYRDKPVDWLWTDKTKINFYQCDGKAKVSWTKGSAHYPKHTSSSASSCSKIMTQNTLTEKALQNKKADV